MRRLPAWQTIFAACGLVAALTGIPARVSGNAQPSPAPTLAARASMLDLSLRVVATAGAIHALHGGWRVGPGPADVTVEAGGSGVALRGISVGGTFQGSGTARIAIQRAGRWIAMTGDDPEERDAPGLFSAATTALALGTTSVLIRISTAGNGTLRDLRAFALGGPPAGCASACAPRAVPAALVSGEADVRTRKPRSTLTATATATPAWRAPHLASDAVRIISRDAWGAPDGEASPNWIPFYQFPLHIVVHHTGEYATPGGALSDMQNIWADHALTHGWGDIGYNYVIDPEGHVYEGRAGGDEVAGAHTHGYNIGSIGISLIGNYDVSAPPAPMLLALRQLITRLADTYGIAVSATQSEGTLTFYGLAGHRDFNQTDCPGQNVYDLLPQLRALIAGDVRSDAALAGASTLYVHAGAPDVALLAVRNTGATTWNGRFSIRRLSGSLPGLPGGFDVPGVPPGGTVTVPLFLPALAQGASFSSRWQLFDAAGTAMGTPFTIGIRVLAPGAATPVPLPTATSTSTATPTPRPSRTPTPRPSRTPTVTATPTHTRTPVPTRTPRSRKTATPTHTATPRPRPTHTPRPRPTASATRTPTPRPSWTPRPTTTRTATHTATPRPTWTPTRTATPTGTPTSTPTIETPVPLVLSTDTPVAPLGYTGVQRATPGAAPGSCGTSSCGSSRGAPRSSGLALYQRAAVDEQPAGATPDPAASAATTWYLADGSSAITDRETIAFYNPNDAPAYVITTLVRGDGHHVYVANDVPPRGRGTLDASDAAGLGDALGAIVHSTQPIYVERTLYHSSPVEEGTGAALLPGIHAPASHWYLPRLRLVSDEAEQVTVLNPGAVPVTVQVDAAERHALRPLRRVTLPALALRTLSLPGGATSAVVRVVTPSTGGVVVEEHTTYGGGRGYTALAGETALSNYGYLLAPGAGDGRDYVMLLNPGTRTARATLTGFDAAGHRLSTLTLTVRAGQDAISRLPAGASQRWQRALLQSDRPLAAGYVGFLAPGGERTLARSYTGSVSAAFTAPALSHVFVEGDTRALLSAPRETLLLDNPATQPAHVRIQLQATGGRHLERDLTLAPGALQRLAINGWAPAGQHSLVVLADRPILAARTIDFNEGVDRLLSYGIAGT